MYTTNRWFKTDDDDNDDDDDWNFKQEYLLNCTTRGPITN